MVSCPVCGRETSESFPVCAQCGAQLSSAKNSNPLLVVLTIVLSVAGLFVIGVLVTFGVYDHRLKSTTAYADAVRIAESSAQVRQSLGSPLREGWFVFGRRREVGQGGFTELTIPISGPRGKGNVFVVANRAHDQWTLENVSFSAGGGKLTDMAPPPAKSTFPMPGTGPIYLVPLGNFDTKLLAQLPDYYRQRFGIDVRILPAMMLDDSVKDPTRNQASADKIADVLRSAPVLKSDPAAIVIGLTDRDMYAYDWNFAISYRAAHQFGVISTARLNDFSSFRTNPALMGVRLRKDLTKNIGLLRGDLPVSRDPTSALYEAISNGSDLDLMGDDFTGADGSWRPYVQQADACISIWRLPDGRLRWFRECNTNPPANTGIETFEMNLSTAEGIEQRTDFDSHEEFPLVLMRKYEDHDPQTHAFGVAGNHSLNIWLYPDDLAGKSYSRAELILPDSGRIYLQRVSKAAAQDRAVFQVQGMSDTPYEGAMMRWNGNGWDLQRNDGWTMVFPDISRAQHQRQAALIGLHDANGHAFQFEREGTGNLMQVTSPWGYKLQFSYDLQRRTTRAWDNRGRSVSYGYDGAGRLASVSSNDGQSVHYAYNGKNRIIAIEDGTGRPIVTNEYGANGLLARQTLGDGRSFEYAYQWEGVRNGEVAVTEPDGKQTQFTMADGEYVQDLPVPAARKINVANNAEAPSQN